MKNVLIVDSYWATVSILSHENEPVLNPRKFIGRKFTFYSFLEEAPFEGEIFPNGKFTAKFATLIGVILSM